MLMEVRPSPREAILKAANHIERYPSHFEFASTDVPVVKRSKCGSPGCAIGWITFYMGFRTGWFGQALEYMGVSDYEFYERIDELTDYEDTGTDEGWYSDPKLCAKGHPAEETVDA